MRLTAFVAPESIAPERVALQTLNKQFAKQMIAQRHTLKSLKDQHGHMKLDYRLLLSVSQDDEK